MSNYTIVPPAFLGALALLACASSQGEEEEKRIDLKRKELDETVWATEVLAETYNASIVELWEKLRESENPLEVLRSFPLGKVEEPNWELNRRLPEKVFEFIHKAPSATLKYLKSYQLQIMINGFVEEGYQVDQVDFRHVGFDVSPNGSAVSRVEFELNVSGPTHTQYRRSFRGVARVAWNREPNEEGAYYPDTISFENFRQYRRTGKLSFEVREWLDGGNNRSPYEYMLIEDFDLDGMPDVLFPRENMLYRNVGDFRFDPRPFVTHHRPDVIDGALFVDIDLDGVREYLVCVRGVGVLAFERSRKSGQYDQKPKTIWDPKYLFGVRTMTAGDVDGDGLPDLFIGQNVEPYVRGILPESIYDANDGLSSYLLLNQGNLKFKESLDKSGLADKSLRRNRAGTIVDLNHDGRMDLVMNSNFAGVDVFSGGEKKLLEDKTGEWLEETQMLGSNQIVADFNRDGRLDLFAGGVTSEFARRLRDSGVRREGFEDSESMRDIMAEGSRLWLGKEGGGFKKFADTGEFERAGWVTGSADVDFNNDGLPDLYLTNGYLSKKPIRDYNELFWRYDLYDTESEDKGELALYFRLEGPGVKISKDERSWAPFQKNRLLMNLGEDGFVDVAYLLGVSHEGDGRAVASEDLNMDGKPDVIAFEINTVDEKAILRIFENTTLRAGNWVGVQLRPAKGRSIIGAQARLIGEDFEAVKTNVFGQANHVQTSSFLRFGIGKASAVKAIEILWPDGETTRIAGPAINRYHAIAPSESK